MMAHGTVSSTLTAYGRIVKGTDELARCEAIDEFAVEWGSVRQRGTLASEHKIGWAHGWNKVMPTEFHHDASALTRMRNMLPCLQHLVEMGHQALVPVNVLRLAMYGLFKSIKDDSLRARILVDTTIALGTPIGGQSVKAEMEAVSEVVKTLAPAHYANWKQAHTKEKADPASEDIVGLMAGAHSLTRDQYEMKLTVLNKMQAQVDALVTGTDLTTLAALDGPELTRLLFEAITHVGVHTMECLRNAGHMTQVDTKLS
jgi:hypothetical protein